jgi:hypothetical protein
VEQRRQRNTVAYFPSVSLKNIIVRERTTHFERCSGTKFNFTLLVLYTCNSNAGYRQFVYKLARVVKATATVNASYLFFQQNTTAVSSILSDISGGKLRSGSYHTSLTTKHSTVRFNYDSVCETDNLVALSVSVDSLLLSVLNTLLNNVQYND